MHTEVAKWGASCAVRIPKMAVESLGLQAGQSVTMEIKGDKLVIKKDAPKYSLEELVAQMDSNKEPDLLLDDEAVGEEIL